MPLMHKIELHELHELYVPLHAFLESLLESLIESLLESLLDSLLASVRLTAGQVHGSPISLVSQTTFVSSLLLNTLLASKLVLS